MQKANPVFDKRIFWDIDFEKLDYDKKANFIIERVFERGDVEDIRQCRRYFGDEKMIEALTGAKWLPFLQGFLIPNLVKLSTRGCYITHKHAHGKPLAIKSLQN